MAHEAARTDQQHDDQEHEGNDVLVDRGDEQDGEGLDHADEKTAELLCVDEGSRLIVCEKRVLAGQTPCIYSIDYLPGM